MTGSNLIWSPRISLRTKAIATILLLQLVVIGIFTYLTVNRHHHMVEKLMQQNYLAYGETLAALSAAAFHHHDLMALESNARHAITHRDIIYVVFEDIHGNRLAFAERKVERKVDLRPLSAGGKTQSEIAIRELGGPSAGLFHQAGHIYDLAIPIKAESATTGYVRVGIFTASLNQEVANVSLWGLKMILAAVLLGALLVGLVDRRMKKTLQGLIATTQRLATGDLSQKITIRTGDQLEELGKSFNKMAEAIQEREQQIVQHQEQLEHIVQQRTSELQEEKDKLRAILDNVPSAFLLLDKELRIQLASSNFEKVVGWKVGLVQGECCSMSLWEQDFCHHCPASIALQSGGIETALAVRKDRAGKDEYLEHIAVPIKKNGAVDAVLEIITNVTERKRLQEQLVRSEKLASTGEMAAVIAHEMRNALTSVKMILQLQMESEAVEAPNRKAAPASTALPLLKIMEAGSAPAPPPYRGMEAGRCPHPYIHKVADSAPLPKANREAERGRGRSRPDQPRSGPGRRDTHRAEPEGRESLGVALDSILRMESVVNELLQFSRPGILQRREENINRILDECIELSRGQLTSKHIRSTKIFDEALPLLPVDSERLKQAVINLLLNAAQAIHDNGEVTLRTSLISLSAEMRDYASFYNNEDSPESEDRLQIQEIILPRGAEVVRIDVQDTGCGIPHSQLQRIFDPFFTTKIDGTGLGLSLVKRIANELGGVVTVESQENKGSTFSIYLPCQ